jgi:antitoxin (DNA-binding transcriptional repressor) of toxin-antitoxin stability system
MRPRLLDATARGEQITITRYSVPVAMLAPPIKPNPDRDAAIEAFRNGSQGIGSGSFSVVHTDADSKTAPCNLGAHVGAPFKEIERAFRSSSPAQRAKSHHRK